MQVQNVHYGREILPLNALRVCVDAVLAEEDPSTVIWGALHNAPLERPIQVPLPY